MTVADPAVSLATTRQILAAGADQAAELASRAEGATLLDLLLQPPSARVAVVALNRVSTDADPVLVDAVCSLMRSHWGSVRAAAVQCVRNCGWLSQDSHLPRWQRQEVLDGGLAILEADRSWTLRQETLKTLAEAGVEMKRLLIPASDPHWRVRHTLIDSLSQHGLSAKTGKTYSFQEDQKSQLDEIESLLEPLSDNPRAGGVLDYLKFLHTGEYDSRKAKQDSAAQANHAAQHSLLTETDPAVLVRELKSLSKDQQQQLAAVMPRLMWHRDDRVRQAASKILSRYGDAAALSDVARLLDDPREFGFASAEKLLGELGDARRERTAELILDTGEATSAQLAWAIEQLSPTMLPRLESRIAKLASAADESSPRLMAAMIRVTTRNGLLESELLTSLINRAAQAGNRALQLAAVAGIGESGPRLASDKVPLDQLLESEYGEVRGQAIKLLFPSATLADIKSWAVDPRPMVRETLGPLLAENPCGISQAELTTLCKQLQRDPHPLVRAASLTGQYAETLMSKPTLESSWYVLQAAAKLTRTPAWEIEIPAVSERRNTIAAQTSGEPPAPLEELDPSNFALLGKDRVKVSRMGLSGHYHLPIAGYGLARDAGINLMFWEPNYDNMTRYFGSLRPRQRSEIHLIAGSFEGTAAGVRRDVQKVLRVLKIERVSFFLMFWVRSWRRINDEVVAELEKLRDSGAIANFSLSTHNRDLAIEAIERSFDPVMVRHSLAHRGAEEKIFPAALQAGTSLITFNNTCYGRLLRPIDGSEAPSASECYRYSLSQPAVTTCLTAPATLDQLRHNLAAVTTPAATTFPERLSTLLEHGAVVYQRDRVFMETVRSH